MFNTHVANTCILIYKEFMQAKQEITGKGFEQMCCQDRNYQVEEKHVERHALPLYTRERRSK